MGRCVVDLSIWQSISVHCDLSLEAGEYTTGHPSPESQIVRIFRQILVSVLSPQMLILSESSPDIYRFWAEY